MPMFAEDNYRLAADPCGSAEWSTREAPWKCLDFSLTTCPSAAGEPVRASVALAKRMLDAASRLVAERYAWRGYIVPGQGALANRDDGRAITLVAETAGATVGTLTVRVDGPCGLRADENYPE